MKNSDVTVAQTILLLCGGVSLYQFVTTWHVMMQDQRAFLITLVFTVSFFALAFGLQKIRGFRARKAKKIVDLALLKDDVKRLRNEERILKLEHEIEEKEQRIRKLERKN